MATTHPVEGVRPSVGRGEGLSDDLRAAMPVAAALSLRCPIPRCWQPINSQHPTLPAATLRNDPATGVAGPALSISVPPETGMKQEAISGPASPVLPSTGRPAPYTSYRPIPPHSAPFRPARCCHVRSIAATRGARVETDASLPK